VLGARDLARGQEAAATLKADSIDAGLVPLDLDRVAAITAPAEMIDAEEGRLDVLVGLALAEALSHPFSIGIALFAAGILHHLRRKPDAIREVGEKMIYGSEKGLRMIVP
jgi:hypothetical protein